MIDLAKTGRSGAASAPRRAGLPIMLCGALLTTACITKPVAAVAETTTPAATFTQQDIALPRAYYQTILTGSFLGNPYAEIVLLSARQGTGIIRIYSFDGKTWQPVRKTRLPRDVLFVDMARIAGRDRLLTYRHGVLGWFDPESATTTTLLSISFPYRKATEQEASASGAYLSEIPRIDITRDINGDGRDDVVIPDFDGFWVATQASDGTFDEAVKLGPGEPFLDDISWVGDARRYREMGISQVTVPIYLSRLHLLDYNEDGRRDLVFWNRDHFDVYLQNPQGSFDPQPLPFTTDVAFDSDGRYTHAFDFTGENPFALFLGTRKSTRRTVLLAFQDIDGDGINDLITQTLSGRSLMRQKCEYRVHFGRSSPAGVTFNANADTTIRPRGRAAGLQMAGYASQLFTDFDDDGRVDVMFRDVRVGLGGMAGAMVGNSVPLDLEFYRFENGRYPDKPITRRKLRRFAPFAGIGNVFFPLVLLGDVTGDGRIDLLVGRNPNELGIFPGDPGPDMFSRKPHSIEIALPPDERLVWLADLNKDGKKDILVFRSPTAREPDNPFQLTTLIAR